MLGHRSAPGSAAAAADMPAVAESSATEETASDASYSADEQSEERYTPAVRQERGSMPSSKASCGVHCLYLSGCHCRLHCSVVTLKLFADVFVMMLVFHDSLVL